MPGPPSPPPRAQPRSTGLRPTALQRCALGLAGALTVPMICANATLLSPLDFISWRYGPIKDTWRPLLIAHMVYGAVVLTYLAAFFLAARRGGWRARDDIIPTAALGALGLLLAGLYTIVPWYSGGFSIQEWECEGLGVPCGVTRFSLAITWPIATLLLGVGGGEAAYVHNRHGHGVWHHTLTFLQAVPPEDLVDARMYYALPSPSPMSDGLATPPDPDARFDETYALRGRGARDSGSSWASVFAREAESGRKPARIGRRSPPV